MDVFFTVERHANRFNQFSGSGARHNGQVNIVGENFYLQSCVAHDIGHVIAYAFIGFGAGYVWFFRKCFQMIFKAFTFLLVKENGFSLFLSLHWNRWKNR